MIYTYHDRGKCNSCGNIIWVMLPEGNVYCSCYEGSIRNRVLTNLSPITDAEHIAEIRIDFWWLPGITADDSITLIKAT